MRALLRLSALVLVLLTMSVPAYAGTAEDPEITDRCGGTVGDDGKYVYAIHESIDLCSGWFETLSEADATPELRMTLEVAGPVADRPPSFLGVWWATGDCNYVAYVDDSTSAEFTQGLQVGCGEPPPPTCTVPEPFYLDCEAEGYYRDFELPAGAVVEDGNELQFTVRFDGALAEFAADHEHDDVLTGLQVLTTVTAGPVYAYTFGCTFGFGQFDRCDEINGDAVWNSEDYTVGT